MSRCQPLRLMKPVLIFLLLGLFPALLATRHDVLVVLGPLQQTGVLHFPHDFRLEFANYRGVSDLKYETFSKPSTIYLSGLSCLSNENSSFSNNIEIQGNGNKTKGKGKHLHSTNCNILDH